MSTAATLQEVAPAPSMKLFGMEPLRAALEYAGMRRMNKRQLPRGDGHPVVIFPGLASDTRATAPLRNFCEELGYKAYDWGRGTNTGPQGDIAEWLRELAEDVQEMVSMHSEGVSLIGWSLGGIYAREVAKHIRPKVRQVITIASPFACDPIQTNVRLLYRLVNGKAPMLDDTMKARLQTAPDVPTTSIYSRSDGIVAWQACVQAGTAAHTENIEVEGSHCGMCWNTSVLSIIADRLNQPMNAWKRYRDPAAAHASTRTTS